MRLLLIALFLFSGVAYAGNSNPAVPDEMVILDSSSNNIPVAYNATAGSDVKTISPNKRRVQIFNDTATILIFSIGGSVCNGSTLDHFVIPVGGNTLEDVIPGTKICLRSSNGVVSSGKVYISNW